MNAPAFITGLALLLAAVAAPVAAQDGGDGATDPIVIPLRALTGEEGGFYFEKDGEKNPTLEVDAGATYTIELTVEGTHNIHIGAPIDEKTPPESDTTQTLTFTVPEDAPEEIPYWCDPHQFMGMAGVLSVSGSTGGNATDDPDASGGDDNTTDGNDSSENEPEESLPVPAPGLLVAAAAAIGTALLVRRRR